MRKLPAIAIAISLLAAASSSFADDSKPTADSTAAAPKKKVAKGGKKKKPVPAPVADDSATAAPAPEPVAPPVAVAAPAPAPAPAPVTTTSATVAPRDQDRLKDDGDAVPPVSVAPLLGIATDNLGFGIGARAGYTFPMKLYVGGQFMYHFGTSPVPEVSVSAFYPSAEVGYEFRPTKGLMVRPYGGLGMMFTSVSVNNNIPGFAGNYSATGHSFVFYPACAVTYTIPNTEVFVGGDARLLLATSYGSYDGAAGFGASFGVFATGGMRF